MKSYCVKDWSPDDQPREKLLQKGVDALSNAELLAILLRSGSRDENVLQLAQRILSSAGNDLNRLSKLSAKQLTHDFKGVGDTKAASIVAALALAKRRKAQEVVIRGKIRTSTEIYNYFLPTMQDLEYEEFWVIFLNHANRIIDRMKISQGGISSTIVDSQIIYKEAVLRLSNQVVICHNHPSGIAQPSSQDDSITATINWGLKMLGINLIDHVIVCGDDFYSYADSGKL
ncbi:MAG: DNA repair protein RadC [Candidatus Symbiothrix sp.]|jgi:DNA repair protein RadC|nr:DNA repair protein RadC [Candidatus Symbiothrix sp.]